MTLIAVSKKSNRPILARVTEDGKSFFLIHCSPQPGSRAMMGESVTGPFKIDDERYRLHDPCYYCWDSGLLGFVHEPEQNSYFPCQHCSGKGYATVNKPAELQPVW